MAEYIDREKLLKRFNIDDMMNVNGTLIALREAREVISNFPAVDVEKMSDGYHTFADLYEQRLILSAALAKNNPHAWKSKRHEDGSDPFGGGWFIMGFDTSDGCYTYHYELKDWNLFQCKELDKGKPWDGHSSKDVQRLLSMPAVSAPQWISVKDRLPEADENPVIAGCEPFNMVFMAWYHGKTKRWEFPSKIVCEVTHWMPTSSLPGMDGAE